LTAPAKDFQPHCWQSSSESRCARVDLPVPAPGGILVELQFGVTKSKEMRKASKLMLEWQVQSSQRFQQEVMKLGFMLNFIDIRIL
jgi:hypothetical protein